MRLRMLMVHVARGYSLLETVVHTKLAKWIDISDIALLRTQAQRRPECRLWGCLLAVNHSIRPELNLYSMRTSTAAPLSMKGLYT